MPAIDLTRLKTQIILLHSTYDDADRFIKSLREIYLASADQTYPVRNDPHASRSFPAYGTPALLNRELEIAFSGNCRSQPIPSLSIIDLLWKEDKLEPRQLAAGLLNYLPVEVSPEVISRVRDWSKDTEDSSLIAFLHSKGTRSLRQETPELWLHTLQEWSVSKNLFLRKLAVSGLIPLITDQTHDLLPEIFHFLTPLLTGLDSHLLYPLQDVVESLAHRSEIETVFFLKQILADSKAPGLPRFIRRCLEAFSPAAQESLKAYMKDLSSS